MRVRALLALRDIGAGVRAAATGGAGGRHVDCRRVSRRGCRRVTLGAVMVAVTTPSLALLAPAASAEVPSCPVKPPSVNVRWHYSANGSAKSWSGTGGATCGKTITLGPQAMEGNLKVSPGATIKAGYDFTLPGNENPVTVSFTDAKVVFAVHCVSGATPSQPTFTLTFPNQSYSVSGSNWSPSGEQSSPLVYQGQIAAPNLCASGSGSHELRLDQGGTFSASMTIPPVGALYAMTNQLTNQIVVFARWGDGSIREVQRIATGGAGSPEGNPPFPQHHLDTDGAVKLTEDRKLLFAVNAGNNTVSSFTVGAQGLLTYVDSEPSGGIHPVSLDSHGGLLYVLNQLVNALGEEGNDISGLSYNSAGNMTPIPGSTRALATPFKSNNGFGFAEPLASQVIFSPNGQELTVPERTSNKFEGQLDTFAVEANGTPGPVNTSPSNAFIPFGLAWDSHGHLIVANAGSPFVNPQFQGSASSYSLSGTTLTPIGKASSTGLATCWVSITNNGEYAFMDSQKSNNLSRFAIGAGGQLTLLGIVPTSGPGADTALSSDSRYLYVLDVLNANGKEGALIDSYRVGSGGGLVKLAPTDPAIPDSASGLAAN
jgi:6-phosphogluconolactonase